MATGVVMPMPKFFAVDGNGTPYAGGKLYTYVAGSTTPLETWTTSAMTVQNANPVILDASGRATIFLSPASYRFVLHDSGDVLVWDIDNIAAGAPFEISTDVSGVAGEALSAGKAVYLSDGSGSLTAGRWYQTDADNAYSSVLAAVVGMVVAAASAAGPVTVRLSGRMTGLAGLVAGTTYYISPTAGAITATRPDTGARIMGRADSSGAFVMDPNPQPLEQVLDRKVTTTTQNTVGPVTHYSDSIEGGTLKTNGRLRFRAICDLLNNTGADQDIRVEVLYGATTIFDSALLPIAADATRRGCVVETDLFANNATNAQVSYGTFIYGAPQTAAGIGAGRTQVSAANTAIAIDSTAAQTFLMRVTLEIADANLVFRTFTCTMEVM